MADPGLAAPKLLWVSAASEGALGERAAALAAEVEADAAASVDALARRLAAEPALPHRRALVVGDIRDAAAMLRKPDPKRAAMAVAAPEPRRVAFVFPGPGDDPPHSLASVYDGEPVFRREVDALQRYARAELGAGDFAPCAGPPAGAPTAAFTSAALFSVELALARLWQSWGVQPTSLLGFSLGELVAATVSGVFGATDGLRVAWERGRLFDGVPRGAMTSVELAADAVAPYLTPQLQVAIVRSPRACVVSGPSAEIDAFDARLKAAAITHVRTGVGTGGHSVLVEPIKEQFAAIVAGVPRQAPSAAHRVISNLSGGWLDAADAVSPAYWAAQLRGTVQFAAGLQSLLASGANLLLEVGPGAHLTSLCARQVPSGGGVTAVASITARNPTASTHVRLLMTAARLWVLGVELDRSAMAAALAETPA